MGNPDRPIEAHEHRAGEIVGILCGVWTSPEQTAREIARTLGPEFTSDEAIVLLRALDAYSEWLDAGFNRCGEWLDPSPELLTHIRKLRELREKLQALRLRAMEREVRA